MVPAIPAFGAWFWGMEGADVTTVAAAAVEEAFCWGVLEPVKP
jgi:hypothetical protein